MIGRIAQAALALGLAVGIAIPLAQAETPFDAAVSAYQGGDYGQARALWEKALAAGDWEAARSLGTLYRRGLGVTADLPKAAEYYRQAAEHGVMSAQLNLAEMTLAGQGVPVDIERAKTLLRGAAAQGNPAAKFRLEEIEEAQARDEAPPPMVRLPQMPPPPGAPNSVAAASEPGQARAHVASYRNDADAAEGWLSYNLPGLTAELEVATIPGEGRFIRLYAVGPANIVRELCDDLKSRRQWCLMGR